MKYYGRKVITMLMVCVLAFCTLIQPAKLEAKKWDLGLDVQTAAQLLAGSERIIAEPQFKSGGSTNTHQYIVTQALTVLRNDKGSSILQNSSIASSLKTYTDWPDKLGNETDFGTFAGHFYNPYTGENILGSTSKTALARAVSYWNQAITSYRSGDITGAIMNLGKGTHYVSDLNEPHHVSDLTALNSNHSAFEKYVNQNHTSFYIKGNTLASSYYQETKSQSISKILKDGAYYAYDLKYKAQDESTYYTAGKLSVQHAIINVTQYLYAFGVSVGIY